MKPREKAILFCFSGFIAALLPFGAKKLALLLFLFSVIAVALSQVEENTSQSNTLIGVIQNTTPKIDLCQLPRKTGRCRALFRNYYYDSAAGECKKFVYGGCGGNENNFNTIEDCQKRCG